MTEDGASSREDGTVHPLPSSLILWSTPAGARGAEDGARAAAAAAAAAGVCGEDGGVVPRVGRPLSRMGTRDASAFDASSTTKQVATIVEEWT